MAIDRARTLKGALAGAAAAGVWAAQQPLDKRAFDSGYDDVELLGKAVTRDSGWYPLGLAMHLANGAAFGAAYAQAAPHAPLPVWAKGPIAGLAEHVAFWPLGVVVDRIHPARKKLTPLAGNRTAFLQAAWRHLLFGVVLGELERRLNPPEPEPPSFEDIASTNGHASLEPAATADATA